MRSRKNNQQTFDSPDMTPMLDIVFIMLIFFIVTTSFLKEEAIDFSRPQSGEAKKTTDKSLIVSIDAMDNLTINGRQVDLLALQANIEAQLVKETYKGAVVKTDRDASSGVLVSAVDQIKLAGFENVLVSN